LDKEVPLHSGSQSGSELRHMTTIMTLVPGSYITVLGKGLRSPTASGKWRQFVGS